MAMESGTDSVRLLVAVPELSASVPEVLAFAQRLSNTADWIECNVAAADAGVQEDAVAMLRWSAAFLRRPAMREEDMPSAFRVVRKVLDDASLAPRGRQAGRLRCIS